MLVPSIDGVTYHKVKSVIAGRVSTHNERLEVWSLEKDCVHTDNYIRATAHAQYIFLQ